MKVKFILLVLIFFGVNHGSALYSADKRLTILHTNDLHSHFLGFSPNRDYSPTITGNDKTIGGWARIAAVIKAEKEKRDNPVLVLDGGDFLMGSLFHMVSREEALELTLIKAMGYDLTTLGNHEFDLGPDGLARILESAVRKGEIPQIIASNTIFSASNSKDDSLEALYKQGLVKPYVVMEKAGLRIGFFGLMGEDAASVAPFAAPVKFGDSTEVATRMVKILRETEKVDLVICISHSGLNRDKSKSEDELLAKNVSGIDIIISGHSHTNLSEPIVQNGTIIVQAWEYGKQVGILDVLVTASGALKLVNHEIVQINDTIAGDVAINERINSAIEMINQKVLQPHNLKFDQVLVKTDFDLHLEEKESTLGNLITDATRWAVDKAEYDPGDPLSRVNISVQSNGVIRDDILKGETGLVTISDLFRTVPLGIGWDGSLSYPLVSMYVTAPEIKKALEVLTSVYPMKGSDYYIQISGAKMRYNPNRMLFDRVTEILIEDEKREYHPLDVSDGNTRLYKIVSNIYNATFLKVIGSFTSGILTIIPKDKNGNPIEDLGTVRVDGDKSQPGIQEIKDWTALMAYVQTFPDQDGDGIPEISEKYRNIEGRQIKDASFNPYKLLAGGNYLTWIALAVIILVLGLITLIIYLPLRIIKKRKIAKT
ncbi:MAG: bifunctional metallophosphatase/5'-nucleotidase [SAR324 cluster bacterium]|nr:bifunctional metallophosphatase/5'-nucleotidase [SAR324 cluster bacterium]